MNTAIQQLEIIGQNTSLKQHDSLGEMLESLNIESNNLKSLSMKEFVCILVPDDDTDDDTDDNSNE